ncbi:zf-HC2 domain-containing protein [Streptomyces stelliscabiei]|uniref:zf-HC2 domain-containing protein n=1 Tax=Streptomyces stelliscabiei TaxID=146820 RepID=UPI0029A5D4FA|nr:zf-HC2 domain-containing protein [Streptomyces stelliscabiei]MDX2553143.1 zf-HC2 domain-containing protein [Streptomyces stelliscabiei]MDX2612131.1 zf-HC2 domain-containing protein [Streptomyces stelliscabiei]MDX2636469.1 zf-HC2 domain-containing protein [Streptomyces stelliscabiei]MDX2663220.1 zf-HC2 domain-containing protein [Streptomyces stelliscabiei]MDX2714315.1 zf-HC2 domain-containing protein [Streptomyces stelliscabiei]
MSVEHASKRIIDGYARGDTDIAADEVWALEAHLEKCRNCRDRLSAAVSTTAPAVTALVGTVWADLEPRLAATAPMPARRRWPARLSRWLTPTTVPWLAMVMTVTLLALLLDIADPGSGPSQVSPLLLLAPVLPVLGVAASWSRGLDPAYELTASVPRAGLPLVLRRTTSVLAVVIPALLAGGGLTGVSAAQWLLPSLAFTSTTLALGGVVGVTRAAAALVAVWAAVVVAPALATSRTPVTLQSAGLPVWGLLLALGIGVVIARRGAYSVLGAHR